MASITKRGNRWIVRWYGTDGVQRTRTVPDQQTARRLSAEVERARALGQDWEPPGARLAPRVVEVAEDYLRDRARRLSARTLTRYGESLDLFERFLGELDGRKTWRVSDLHVDLLSKGWDWLRNPETGLHGRQRSESTCRKHIEVWRLLWEWAHERDEADQVPRPRSIDLPKLRRPRPVAPGWDQVDSMLAALLEGQKARRRRWLWRLALIARYTGARRGELLALRWSEVDLDQARLEFLPETTKGEYGGRIVPLHPALVAEVRGWEREGDFVVDAPEKERDGTGRHLGRSLGRAWRRAGVPDAVWKRHPLHVLRSGLRTHLAAAGTHPDIIDAILGHAAQGTGSKHYTDRALLWEPAAKAIAESVPAHGQAAGDGG